MIFAYLMKIIVLLECDDKTIKFIDMKNKKVVKNINGHNMGILTIKKLIIQNMVNV